MDLDASAKTRLNARLQEIYGPAGQQVLPDLLRLLEQYRDLSPAEAGDRWSERDVVLITYGDQVRAEGVPALEALRQFLSDHQLADVINTVHVLPFCPYTSDDGFSVIDYLAVSPDLGSWDDLNRLSDQHDLMFDLVLNHVSQKSPWFEGYLRGDPKYANYFIEMDPATELSMVTRPRSLPLLTEFETSRGPRHLWTTFSGDQLDLNYANPAVLLDVLQAMLFYIRHGARFIRLDAIAYLWKEVSTTCIHLPQTHAIVKLMRDVVDLVAPHVILLTETNVPHPENISYFGDGDEAHMVYQFSLPPLLADALLRHDASALQAWLASLEEAGPGTTYFNFTASHDGVGVRPLEGLLAAELRSQLVDAALERGGLVGTKRNPDGTDAPYELNVTYFDLLSDVTGDDANKHVARFFASQAIMLSLRGVPGIYFHSLVGTHNDAEAASSSGINRRINRRRFTRTELDAILDDHNGVQQRVFQQYKHLLAVRTSQPAFHPEASQDVMPSINARILAFARENSQATQRILVVANLAAERETVDVSAWGAVPSEVRELISNRTVDCKALCLDPFQVAWLDVTMK